MKAPQAWLLCPARVFVGDFGCSACGQTLGYCSHTRGLSLSRRGEGPTQQDLKLSQGKWLLGLQMYLGKWHGNFFFPNWYLNLLLTIPRFRDFYSFFPSILVWQILNSQKVEGPI